ncbi:hypothetical protein ACQPZ2_00935 [Nocardia pseudovaccinii]|uniref:hypothetical protein n=1 Tax=Nocardia pseudovaccinii TaxID=189540 RepID=UPI003D8D7BF3
MSDSDKPAQAIPGIQDLLDQRDTQAAVQKAADAQTRTGRADTELGDLGAGTDPDFVRTEEHFEGMTLEAMYAAVHGGADGGGMDAAGLKTLRQTLFDCYSELANASTFNLMGMNRIFGNGLWQGASGSAAQTASEQYSKVANQVARVFESVSGRLDSLAWAAEAVRLAVPAPPTTVTAGADPDNTQQSVLPGLVNPSYSDQLDDTREEARQAAIRALNSVYKGNFPPAGAGVPTYLVVPEVGGAQGPGVGNGSNTDGSGANAPSTTGTGAEDSGSQQQNQTTPSAAAPSSSTPTTTAPASTSTTGTASSPSTATTPTGLGNGPTSTGTGPGSGIPTDAGHGTNRNTAGGPGSVSRPGGPGSSVPGVPGVAAPAAGATRAGATASARSGIGSAGAPGAAGRRKDGEDDAEHHSPDYLRGVASDWTEGLDTPVEVIGDDFVADSDPLFTAEPTWTPPARAYDFSPPSAASDVAPTGIEPAEVRTEPALSTRNTPGGSQAEVAPGTTAAPPQTGPTPEADDNAIAADPGDTASGAKSAGFSGAGPSLDDLLSEYGWDVDTTSDTPIAGADTAAGDQATGKSETSGSGANQ